ncbi:5-formyltetrahydrofolate cyclo-ligase [Heliobacillus mobilis]|uniref:5-formyltetrahydrofolate cyclo-ligase n=1 Tax=Heliobacterium mobile TaxID=28064 RepID=A0A6I3SJ78_HELMO|nr:5-formyltetrahydrofolate cyclo-ligase [Heliobacterium mobile]MTV48954.1 5-formyltetrahydrofolate cyclo-ligase [Heliobacterium mobile]
MNQAEKQAWKQKIRQSVLALRSRQTHQEVAEKSSTIVKNLLSHTAYNRAKMIMTYVDFRQEVETKSLIQQALLNAKGIAVPVTQKEERRLIPAAIFNYPDDLQPGTWGILEPRQVQAVPAQEIDLIVIPGVAFDLRGNRLGYGAGFYDRFLPSLPPDTPKIAFAFELQLMDELISDEHDIPMDLIITESRIINCREGQSLHV